MKFHVISQRDLNRLIKQGDVVLNDNGEYNFHGGMPKFIALLNGGMSKDIITSQRWTFNYNMDINNDNVNDPFIDGLSGEFGKWFVPIWCVVEWLKKRGIL